jgi:hypothetical protein
VSGCCAANEPDFHKARRWKGPSRACWVAWLGAEESSAVRAQLIQEIETQSEDDLQLRAIAILKPKNRLSMDDAKLVEEAFAAKMALQGATLDAPVAEELSSAPPSDPIAPRQPGAIKPVRPKGAPQEGQSDDRAIRCAPGYLKPYR